MKLYSIDELKRLFQEWMEIYGPIGVTRNLRVHPDREAIKASLDFHTKDLQFPEAALKTKVYWLLFDMKELPRCLACGKEIRGKDIRNMRDGFPIHCSPACARRSDHSRKAYKETCMVKYGVENVSTLRSVKAKKAATTMAHYGVSNPMQADSVKKAVRETVEARYGGASPQADPAVREKSEATCLERFGARSFSSTPEHKAASAQTNLAKYGAEWPNMLPEFRKKVRRRYSYQGEEFDSSAELAFYAFHKDAGHAVEHEPQIAFPYSYEGQDRTYHPDFRLDGQLTEVKGLQFFEDRDPSKRMVNPYDHSQDGLYEAKRQCMLANGVRILTDSDCRPFAEYMAKKYGPGWKEAFRNGGGDGS